MKLSLSAVVLGAMACASMTSVNAFSSPAALSRSTALSMSTMAESGVPPATSEASDTADAEIPTNLPSECGMDYIPLATMLATGELAQADQVRLYFHSSPKPERCILLGVGKLTNLVFFLFIS